MFKINELLTQSYPWISLLGGLHCLALTGFARFIERDKQERHWLLVVIFCTAALYFFAGLILYKNSFLSASYQLIFIAPIYFLITPLVYLYSQQSLRLKQSQASYYKHLTPAILGPLALFFITKGDDFSLGFGLMLHFDNPQTSVNQILVKSILPILLNFQACFYFVMLLRLLNQHKSYCRNTIERMQFHWVLLITLSLLFNWVARMVILLLSVKFDMAFSAMEQVLAQLSLLATIYIAAMYGLKQVITSAHLPSNISSQTSSPNTPSSAVLDADEIKYLREVLGSVE